MRDLLSELNERQREAVVHNSGALMIIAGAGSGKTKVITSKIAYLLTQGIHPKEILALTFSNKAAQEMKERVLDFCKGNSPMISTFHSFGYHLISRYASHLGLTKKLTVYDTQDQLQVIKNIIQELQFPMLKTENKGEISPYVQLQNISKLRNNVLEEEGYNSDLERLRQEYEKVLHTYNALDFDDLILKSNHLLSLSPIAKQIHSQFKYILVDEYQDTSAQQFDMLRQIAGENDKVSVVGDDDQSIYSWRGANLDNWNKFSTNFPNYTEIILDTSYRCSPIILNAANAIISQGSRMREKSLKPHEAHLHKDHPIRIYALQDEDAEAQCVADLVLRFHYEYDLPWKEIGILTRTNNLFSKFEIALQESQIPYSVSGGKSFFEHLEVKDLIAYLRLMFNTRDDISLKRVLNTPKRGIGLTSLHGLSEYALQQSHSLFEACIHAGAGEIDGIRDLPQRACYDFTQMIRECAKSVSNGTSLSECLKYIIGSTNYMEYLNLQYSKHTRLLEWKIDNVHRLIDIVTQFELRNIPAEDIINVLTYSTQQDSQPQDDTVSLMTVHAAKGLEMEAVIIVGMEQGLFPHFRSLESSQEAIHEETRLCYVAVTRAKSHLHFTWSVTRKNKRTQSIQQRSPSPFLEMIPKDTISHKEPEHSLEKSMDLLDQMIEMTKK